MEQQERESIIEMDDVIRRTGGFGRFQILTTLILTLSFTSGGYVIYCIPLLEYMPEDYFCRTSTTAPWEPCDHDAYCSAQYSHSDLRRVDYDSPYSLHNWVEQLDIYCTNGFELGVLGAVYYLGYLIGNAIFVTPSDVYGRKWFVFAGCMLHSVAYLAMLFSKSLYLNYFLVLMCGTASPMRSNICYVMALEFVPKTKQVFVATFI